MQTIISVTHLANELIDLLSTTFESFTDELFLELHMPLIQASVDVGPEILADIPFFGPERRDEEKGYSDNENGMG